MSFASGLIPRRETQSADFITKFPQFDGRGIKVGILDTGLDVGVEGLRVTTTNQVKVVDSIDCTGDGDIFCVRSEETSPEGPRSFTGLSGKKLTLGNDEVGWKNPSNKWNLGMKMAYDIFPAETVNRLKEDRKTTFQVQHRTLYNQAQTELQKIDTLFPTKELREKKKKELEERVSQLNELMKSYNDAGPIIDVVWWFDGAEWKAVCSIREDGDLTKCKVLRTYRVAHEYDTFSEQAALNFSVNILDNGRLVSLVTVGGSHGTHVAGIVAANYPNHPELNGVAPGAQIVNLKIGDCRLGTMETVQALCRAIQAARDTGCDIINLSYGEPSSFPNVGRFIELSNQLVWEDNVLFFCSAGNNGPGLTSGGSPGSTSSCTIAIGACVTSEMMSVEYSMLEELPDCQYTWSSRGPISDGLLGVDVSAPGGAIAPVPTNTLQKSQLMNGTSMSSPNCAGCGALLLSALKANSQKYSAEFIRRALVNTAKPVKGTEIWANGAGMVQTLAAYEWIQSFPLDPADDVRFVASFPDLQKARGIYLREAAEQQTPLDTVVNIEAIFRNGEENNKYRIGFEKRLVLHATQPWVTVPKQFFLTHGVRGFRVRVDPTALEEGKPHFAHILAVEEQHSEAGPLFRIPITVCRPASKTSIPRLPFEPGKIDRNFIHVPQGATCADIEITPHNLEFERRFMIHIVQIVTGKPFTKTSTNKFISLLGNKPFIYRVPVIGGCTLEFCLAQFWSSLGKSEVSYSVQFQGVEPLNREIGFNSVEQVSRVQVVGRLKAQKLSPSGVLKFLGRTLSPSSSAITLSADPRDVFPESKKLHALQISYDLMIDEETVEAKFRLPIISDFLYDSNFDSRFYYVLNGQNKIVGKGDAWPQFHKLSRGAHTIKFNVRHDSLQVLEGLKEAPLSVEFKLANRINLKFFSSPISAQMDQNPFSEMRLEVGKVVTLYVKVPTENLPRGIRSADSLIGTVKYLAPIKSNKLMKSGSMPIVYFHTTPNKETKVSEEFPADIDSFNKFMFMNSVKYLKQLDHNSKEFETLYKEFSEKNTSTSCQLALMQVQLGLLDQPATRDKNLTQIIDLAGKIVKMISVDDLAKHYGQRLDSENSAMVKERKKCDEQKEILVDVLDKQIRAMADSQHPDIKATIDEMRKWAAEDDLRLLLNQVQYQKAQNNFAMAIKLINTGLKPISTSKRCKEFLQLRCDLVKSLGWACWVQNLAENLFVSVPADANPTF